MDSVAMETNTTPAQERLVHLDLKGAPPRISYYDKLFPLLESAGCTGLLVEYEDMFPYWGNLETLAVSNAYSKNEVQALQQLAATNNLKVIPLVQTFGHFEFVLKHDAFVGLREVESFPMALCPLNEEAFNLVTSMLDQVILLHPDSEWIHIGADEVFHMGLCEKCSSYLREQDDPLKLFFHHVRRVLQHVRKKHPKLKTIMWDDMFRKTTVEMLKDADIGDLVEPMVWDYNVDIHIAEDLWSSYSMVFPHVWVGSAFKGATGPCQITTDASHHMENHLSWMKLMQQQASQFQTFRGYAVTGWQRYDHYAVLCELMPVGLPCLVLCLHLLKQGPNAVFETAHQQTSELLRFSELIPLNPFKCLGHIPACDFPGSTVYTGIHLVLLLLHRHKLLLNNDRVQSWMSPYHLEHKFCNPAHLQNFLPEANELLCQMTVSEQDLSVAMQDDFYPDTIDEWLSTYLRPAIKALRTFVTQTTRQISHGAHPKMKAT